MHKVFWHQSENFGDKLTPWLFDFLEIPYEYVDRGCKEDHYIMTGSILPACNEHSIIWGAGIAQSQDIAKPKLITAVRGGWTRSDVLESGWNCPAVYGDISILLPMIFNYTRKTVREIGVIPHMIDRDKQEGEFQDVTDSVENIVDYILESETIQTSSLHVAMTAKFFKKEVRFVASPDVIGQDHKWYDFYMTYVNGAYNLLKFIQACPIQEMKDKLMDIYDEVRISNS